MSVSKVMTSIVGLGKATSSMSSSLMLSASSNDLWRAGESMLCGMEDNRYGEYAARILNNNEEVDEEKGGKRRECLEIHTHSVLWDSSRML